jgi:hypothetical protein
MKPAVDPTGCANLTRACSLAVLLCCACGSAGNAGAAADDEPAPSNFAAQVSASAQAGSGGGTQARATLASALAFPGAQGFGAMSAGGRGGAIVQVTTLADSGPGSFRNCVTMRVPRVCVFRVNGVIRFTGEPPVITAPYLTIAGETAPGEGITLTHSGGSVGVTPLVFKNTHDIIVRHIRSRPDRLSADAGSNDAITIEGSYNVIVDHVSASWAMDENINGYGQNDNVTVSWSIFAEGIPKHDKCALLASDPTGPQRFSFLHNLCAHNGDRNPDANFFPGSCVEIINNVFYNAQSQFTEIWETYGGAPVAIVANFYKAGPNTATSATGIDREQIGSTGAARIYQSANSFDGNFQHIEANVPAIEIPAPECGLGIVPTTAAAAYSNVLGQAGSFPRDPVDRRIVDEVRNRGGRIVREPGVIRSSVAAAPYPDRDRDGMSDRWEAANGTNPATQDAWGDGNANGIANIIEFLDYAHRQRSAQQPVT